jgi:hypothetical protein
MFLSCNLPCVNILKVILHLIKTNPTTQNGPSIGCVFHEYVHNDY